MISVTAGVTTGTNVAPESSCMHESRIQLGKFVSELQRLRLFLGNVGKFTALHTSQMFMSQALPRVSVQRLQLLEMLENTLEFIEQKLASDS